MSEAMNKEQATEAAQTVLASFENAETQSLIIAVQHLDNSGTLMFSHASAQFKVNLGLQLLKDVVEDHGDLPKAMVATLVAANVSQMLSDTVKAGKPEAPPDENEKVTIEV